MIEIENILLEKFSDDSIGHFYILSPSLLTHKEDFLKSWSLELIAKTLSDEKKCFNSENVLNHEDLLYLSKDDKENGNYKLSDFSELFNFLNYNATRYKRKIVIIDHAHKLSVNVSNKLLKTLEEPPILCSIFLLNNDKASILETIKSRGIKLNIPAPKSKINLDEMNLLLQDIENGLSLDEFISKYKGNKNKEKLLFKSLNDWLNKKSSNAQHFEKLDIINKQTLEDHTFNASALNRMHKIYDLLKEIIDG